MKMLLAVFRWSSLFEREYGYWNILLELPSALGCRKTGEENIFEELEKKKLP